MSKYIIMAILFVYLSLITLIADSMAYTSGNIGVVVPEGTETNPSSFLTTFWDMLTFQIDLPSIMIIFLVYPAIIIILFIMLDIIIEIARVIAEAIPL